MSRRSIVILVLVLLVIAGATSVVMSSISASGSSTVHSMPDGKTMQNDEMGR